MEQTYEEFEKEFLDDIRINAQIEGTTPDDYFLNDILGRLTSMGELIDPQIRPMQKRCRNQKIMSFDAFAFDESDKSVVLITKKILASSITIMSVFYLLNSVYTITIIVPKYYRNKKNKIKAWCSPIIVKNTKLFILYTR